MLFRFVKYFLFSTVIKLVITGKFLTLYYLTNHRDLSRPDFKKSLFLTAKQDAAISLCHELIDIIIPVYNGRQYLPGLFKSLNINTDGLYRVIVIEDRSSDPDVWPFLQEIKEKNPDRIVLMRNSQNIGFVESINRGFQQTKGHFVILNSDVEVPSGWLSRLIRPIIESEKIASVTPFTNSGTICSFPRFCLDNPPYENLPVEVIDSYFRRLVLDKTYLEIPTGVGFCMAFNRKVVEKIGLFDAKAYGRGYSEENDWCMRARRASYHNVIALNLYVYHVHGGSFTAEEKKELLKKNREILLKRYPDYDYLVDKFVKSDPLKPIRDFLELSIQAGEAQSHRS